MKVADVMTTDVRCVAPDDSVRDAARLMDELNVCALPVLDGDRLVGIAQVERRMAGVQVRRLPVLDVDGRLVGVVSLGGLAAADAQGTDTTLQRISTPAEPDRSRTPAR